jgi:L,D-transpeptidase ErfK/SrfK
MTFRFERRRLLQGLGAGLVAALAGRGRLAWARGDDAGSSAYAPWEWGPYVLPLPKNGSRLVGRPHHVAVRAGQTLLDVARKFDVGYWDIVLANPDLDLWLPEAGARVLIPSQYILPDAPQEGIVVNVAEMRLYYYPPAVQGKRYVITHPVGIGRQDWATPLGRTRIVEMIADPTWYPPASIRADYAARGEPLPAIVPPGPDNPLGRHALILDMPGYLIHGTHKPEGVGMQVSYGCIRLYPEDIARLFTLVRRGTPVWLVNQPIKTTWSDGRLYAQLRPLPQEGESGRLRRKAYLPVLSQFRHQVEQAALAAGFLVPDSFSPDQALASGLPVTVPVS